jgi:hypothetical protein
MSKAFFLLAAIFAMASLATAQAHPGIGDHPLFIPIMAGGAPLVSEPPSKLVVCIPETPAGEQTCIDRSALPAVLPIPTPAPGIVYNPPATVLGWTRRGGVAGVCVSLMVDDAGGWVLANCATDEKTGKGQLEPDDWDSIANLRNTWASFKWSTNPFTPPDTYRDSISLAGIGTGTPTNADAEAIDADLAALAERLAAK